MKRIAVRAKEGAGNTESPGHSICNFRVYKIMFSTFDFADRILSTISNARTCHPRHVNCVLKLRYIDNCVRPSRMCT